MVIWGKLDVPRKKFKILDIELGGKFDRKYQVILFNTATVIIAILQI